jgi:hypothetical protein
MDRLYHERAIALGLSIDPSSSTTYTSATNSFLTFVKMHNLPVDPTKETLSLYVTYMCAHIIPRSVNSYLSGICNQLEPFFPEVRANRNSALVSRTLAGCMRRFGTPVVRKRPITEDDIVLVIGDIGASRVHDDLLFLSMLTSGRDGLLRLGEMTMPDYVRLRNARKLSLRHTVNVFDDRYSYFLPYHKADRFYEGNIIIIQRTARLSDPHSHFLSYLHSRDALFPLNRELWLRSNGTVPTRSWFIARIKQYFPHDVAGQSLRAGGATSLAEAGIPPEVIRGIGRWASDAFQIYIRKNPVLLQAMLFGRPVHQPPAIGPA